MKSRFMSPLRLYDAVCQELPTSQQGQFHNISIDTILSLNCNQKISKQDELIVKQENSEFGVEEQQSKVMPAVMNRKP
ncbi:unnamed protein product, partial [Leptidea sinapis]